jgi:glycosyltransferase involved in cell wall biosynthesis
MKIHIFSAGIEMGGIASYTKCLRDAESKLGLDTTCTFIAPLKRNPVYYLRLAYKVPQDCNVVHVQFDYVLGKLGAMTGIYIPLFYGYLKVQSWIRHFKIVTTMHEIWERQNPPKFGRLGSIYVELINRAVFSSSDCLIVFAGAVGNRLKMQGVPADKIFLTPHGSPPPRYMDRRLCKRRLGLDPDAKVVTIFGFVKRSKGHDLLIRAARHLSQAPVVLIAGGLSANARADDAVYLERLKRMASGRTVFLGTISDEMISVIMNATDIMVLPYRALTHSGIVNWALTYGIPTVASNLVYFKEIHMNYSCLVLFDSGSVPSLTRTIDRLLGDSQVQAKLRSACQKYRNENSFSRVAEETCAIYLRCLKRSD